jgi:DNA polymerase-3 subunit delta'
VFENIIGNDSIKQELEQTIKLNKLSHSYLFLGTDGIGKKQIAKEFAKMILCLDEKKYCNNCKSCLEFDSNNNPDFQLIEPDGTSIKIEQIRQLQRKILEAPIISNKKVYIIDDADLMTNEAQNCLLKTIEEPPEFVTIILIGSKESSFLSTIKSRCMIIKFQNISDEQIKKYLKDKYQMNDISENMLEIFQGSIGKAEVLREKQELYNSVSNVIEKIKSLDLIDFLKTADIIYKSQDDKYDILESINVLLFNKSKQDIRFLNCIDIVEDTKRRLNSNGNYNMCIDNMLFKIWEEMH